MEPSVCGASVWNPKIRVKLTSTCSRINSYKEKRTTDMNLLLCYNCPLIIYKISQFPSLKICLLKKKAPAIQHLDTNNVSVVRHFEYEIPRQLKELLLSREYIQLLKLSPEIAHKLMKLCNWQPNDLTRYQGGFSLRACLFVFIILARTRLTWHINRIHNSHQHTCALSITLALISET